MQGVGRHTCYHMQGRAYHMQGAGRHTRMNLTPNIKYIGTPYIMYTCDMQGVTRYTCKDLTPHFHVCLWTPCISHKYI